eukprot:CAMPEP_0170542386 /NCGR_PEP_ID=MMETSP0211-20121228/1827_1 /TAXON_ID=311385 /ORGANISM="Pseudokeronopsis sp., Strain OXSARD2" /LENGTH=76 /DNA_ID=CAMNT_0010845427 /DNA_START=1159 /DNA_END=1389 /DNA_ORIENTATION=-
MVLESDEQYEEIEDDEESSLRLKLEQLAAISIENKENLESPSLGEMELGISSPSKLEDISQMLAFHCLVSRSSVLY